MNNELHSVFKKYLEEYFLNRNLDATVRMFGLNATGYGTGIDENTYDFKSLAELYQRDIAEVSNPVSYVINKLHIHCPESNIGIISAELDIEFNSSNQIVKLNNFRLSMTWVKYDPDWLIEHMHISLPTDAHGDKESYPIKELEEQNVVLQRLVEKKTEELSKTVDQLQEALANVKTITGLIPICMHCKGIRDQKGAWSQLEVFIAEHSDAQFSHGICDKCLEKYYPDLVE